MDLLGRRIDDDKLVRTVEESFGDGRVDVFPGDSFHARGKFRDVLNVDGCNHVNAGGHDVANILPAIRIHRSGRIIPRKSVHQTDARMAGEDGADVDGAAAKLRNDFECGWRSAGGLYRPDDQILSARGAPATLIEHARGLAHT